MTQFDGRNGLNLCGCHKLLQDPVGRIYAMSSYGIYVYSSDPAKLPAGVPRPRRPTILGDVAWRLGVGVYSTWNNVACGEGWLALRSTHSNEVELFDARTGQKKGAVPIRVAPIPLRLC